MNQQNEAPKNKIIAKNLNLFYDKRQILFDVNIELPQNSVTALIGASGCGKSSFLRCINRMNDSIENCLVKGEILLDDKNILDKNIDITMLRTKVGMVFQKPNPFPISIYDNVAFGPRIHNLTKSKEELDDLVYSSLERVGLLSSIEGKIRSSAFELSGGQQQRLCIARTIATKPDTILMDEPCSALDPIATAKIENLITELSSNYTIVIVTHSMQQAARISHHTGFFYYGKILEFGTTANVFTNPKIQETEDYISGRFG
jgi:phosphate transport system ATP-binding protein